MGRTSHENAPSRDIDLLMYGGMIADQRNLRLPIPGCLRAFTLIPLAEIAPDYIHPARKRPLVAGQLDSPR